LACDADPEVVAATAAGYQSSGDPKIDPEWAEWGSEIAGVNYTGLIPYTIKAIQELDDAIAAKDAVIADLIARIEKLEAKP
jgi:hypothetical protein